jgi:small ligand-binding sensory domain FIST
MMTPPLASEKHHEHDEGDDEGEGEEEVRMEDDAEMHVDESGAQDKNSGGDRNKAIEGRGVTKGSDTRSAGSSSSSSSAFSSRPSEDGQRDISHGSGVASAASAAASLNEAMADCAARALADLGPGGPPPDAALVFVSARYAVGKVGPNVRESLADVAPCMRTFFPGLKAVFGCTTDGVIGDGVEFEARPALALTLLRLPNITLKTFHVMPDDVPSLDGSQAAWRRVFGNIGPPASSSSSSSSSSLSPPSPPAFLLLSDPAFAECGDLQRCLAGLEFAYPGCTVFGSVASAGGGYSKGHMLCTLPRDVLGATISSALRDNGLVGLALSGDVEVDCIVAQSCRAIGPTFEVRKVAHNNMLLEMEQVGRPASIMSALGHLRSLIEYATPTERKLMETELHIGFAPNEFDDAVSDDDFIVRNVIAFDQDTGGITLGCPVRPGQRIRFAIKDDRTAETQLDAALQRFKRAELTKTLIGYGNPPLGALMFVDEGRGAKLFREPDFETRQLAKFVPGVPLSGFFGGAQIGPSRTSQGEKQESCAVIHSASSVIAFIRNRSAVNPLNPPSTPDINADGNA